MQVGKLNPEEGGTLPGSQSGLGSRKRAGRQGSDPHASHTVGAEAGRAGGLGGLLPGEQWEGPSTWLKQIWGDPGLSYGTGALTLLSSALPPPRATPGHQTSQITPGQP